MSIIQRELKRGGDITDQIMSGKSMWKELFLKNTFFVSGYKYYLTVVAASPTEEAQLIWSGFVESKVRILVALLEENENIALAHPFNKGFERVVKCHSEEEIEKAKNGLEVPVRQDPVESTDSAQQTNGESKEENGKTEKPTTIYTSRWYIGLQLREGKSSPCIRISTCCSTTRSHLQTLRLCFIVVIIVQLLTKLGAKSLDVHEAVDNFKATCFRWQKYDKELNALNVCTSRK